MVSEIFVHLNLYGVYLPSLTDTELYESESLMNTYVTTTYGTYARRTLKHFVASDTSKGQVHTSS